MSITSEPKVRTSVFGQVDTFRDCCVNVKDLSLSPLSGGYFIRNLSGTARELHTSQSFSLRRVFFENFYIDGEDIMDCSHKRITLLAGHYGSGKTNVAVNMAFALKKKYDRVLIADLDIVNPYFRTKDSQSALEDNGIRVICSEYANSNVDIPALPQEMYSIVDDKSYRSVVDIGGDERGALALGRYSEAISAENDYDMLLVINRYRPMTPDAASTLEIMREIEAAGKIRFTGIVNNSNLGADTTSEDVLNSMEYAADVSRAAGLPIAATCVMSELFDELKDKIPELFALDLQKKVI